MKAKGRATAVSKAAAEVFERLGLTARNSGVFAGEWFGSGAPIEKVSPIDGSALASATTATQADIARLVDAAQQAFLAWRDVPAPKRGELARRYAEALRLHRRDLGRLVTLETGKIWAKARAKCRR